MHTEGGVLELVHRLTHVALLQVKEGPLSALVALEDVDVLLKELLLDRG